MIDDHSRKSGFVVEPPEAHPVTVTGAAFVGTKRATLTLTKGQWQFFTPGRAKRTFESQPETSSAAGGRYHRLAVAEPRRRAAGAAAIALVPTICGASKKRHRHGRENDDSERAPQTRLTSRESDRRWTGEEAEPADRRDGCDPAPAGPGRRAGGAKQHRNDHAEPGTHRREARDRDGHGADGEREPQPDGRDTLPRATSVTGPRRR